MDAPRGIVTGGNLLSICKLVRIHAKAWLLIVILIYILGFLGATYNHVMDLVHGGLFPYQKMTPNVPSWLNIYWTLLTILDPLSILLLVCTIDIGLLMYLIVITSDVIINYWYVIGQSGILGIFNYGQLCQFCFMIFVLFTYIPIKREIVLLKNRESHKE